jgi:predicted nucleic acid-binding protein
VNWIDSQLLVYSVIESHPAQDVIQAALTRDAWGSTILTLGEVYHVLTRDYRVTSADARELTLGLAHSNLHWVGLDAVEASAAIVTRSTQSIDLADAVLLSLAASDPGVLVTSDRRLLGVAVSQGVAVRNPIDPPLSVAVARWEAQNLPPKGLQRILVAVERWLRQENPMIAERFVTASDRLTRLP